jgi:hypothetical protein
VQPAGSLLGNLQQVNHAPKLVLTCHDRLPFVQPRLWADMALQGEVILRQRACSGCHALFWICEHCDRGQRYCSPACRSHARRQQRRGANDRYQRSPEGQLDHRDRQQKYRRRCRERTRVTDQGSLSIASSTPFGCGISPATPAAASSIFRATCVPRGPEKRPSPSPRCIVCGRSGRFVDPFPRIPRYPRSR